MARQLGSNNSLSTPHEYDLGTALAPGKHRLTIRVDNRLVVDVGVNSHCVTDHTQGNWNGIVGAIELRCDPPPWSASDGLMTVRGLAGIPVFVQQERQGADEGGQSDWTSGKRGNPAEPGSRQQCHQRSAHSSAQDGSAVRARRRNRGDGMQARRRGLSVGRVQPRLCTGFALGSTVGWAGACRSMTRTPPSA